MAAHAAPTGYGDVPEAEDPDTTVVVANIPEGVSEIDVVNFMSGAILAVTDNDAVHCTSRGPCSGFQMALPQGGFHWGTLRLRTALGASVAVHLSGIGLRGSRLSVVRPRHWRSPAADGRDPAHSIVLRNVRPEDLLAGFYTAPMIQRSEEGGPLDEPVWHRTLAPEGTSRPTRPLGQRAYAAGLPISHYKVLGVSPSSSTKEIRMAYLEKSRKCHPNAHPSNKEDEDETPDFRKVEEAYRTLSNTVRRNVYDKFNIFREVLEGELKHDYHTMAFALKYHRTQVELLSLPQTEVEELRLLHSQVRARSLGDIYCVANSNPEASTDIVMIAEAKGNLARVKQCIEDCLQEIRGERAPADGVVISVRQEDAGLLEKVQQALSAICEKSKALVRVLQNRISVRGKSPAPPPQPVGFSQPQAAYGLAPAVYVAVSLIQEHLNCRGEILHNDGRKLDAWSFSQIREKLFPTLKDAVLPPAGVDPPIEVVRRVFRIASDIKSRDDDALAKRPVIEAASMVFENLGDSTIPVSQVVLTCATSKAMFKEVGAAAMDLQLRYVAALYRLVVRRSISSDFGAFSQHILIPVLWDIHALLKKDDPKCVAARIELNSLLLQGIPLDGRLYTWNVLLQPHSPITQLIDKLWQLAREQCPGAWRWPEPWKGSPWVVGVVISLLGGNHITVELHHGCSRAMQATQSVPMGFSSNPWAGLQYAQAQAGMFGQSAPSRTADQRASPGPAAAAAATAAAAAAAAAASAAAPPTFGFDEPQRASSSAHATRSPRRSRSKERSRDRSRDRRSSRDKSHRSSRRSRSRTRKKKEVQLEIRDAEALTQVECIEEILFELGGPNGAAVQLDIVSRVGLDYQGKCQGPWERLKRDWYEAHRHSFKVKEVSGKKDSREVELKLRDEARKRAQGRQKERQNEGRRRELMSKAEEQVNNEKVDEVMKKAGPAEAAALLIVLSRKPTNLNAGQLEVLARRLAPKAKAGEMRALEVLAGLLPFQPALVMKAIMQLEQLKPTKWDENTLLQLLAAAAQDMIQGHMQHAALALQAVARTPFDSLVNQSECKLLPCALHRISLEIAEGHVFECANTYLRPFAMMCAWMAAFYEVLVRTEKAEVHRKAMRECFDKLIKHCKALKPESDAFTDPEPLTRLAMSIACYVKESRDDSAHIRREGKASPVEAALEQLAKCITQGKNLPAQSWSPQQLALLCEAFQEKKLANQELFAFAGRIAKEHVERGVIWSSEQIWKILKASQSVKLLSAMQGFLLILHEQGTLVRACTVASPSDLPLLFDLALLLDAPSVLEGMVGRCSKVSLAQVDAASLLAIVLSWPGPTEEWSMLTGLRESVIESTVAAVAKLSYGSLRADTLEQFLHVIAYERRAAKFLQALRLAPSLLALVPLSAATSIKSVREDIERWLPPFQEHGVQAPRLEGALAARLLTCLSAIEADDHEDISDTLGELAHAVEALGTGLEAMPAVVSAIAESPLILMAARSNACGLTIMCDLLRKLLMPASRRPHVSDDSKLSLWVGTLEDNAVPGQKLEAVQKHVAQMLDRDLRKHLGPQWLPLLLTRSTRLEWAGGPHLQKGMPQPKLSTQHLAEELCFCPKSMTLYDHWPPVLIVRGPRELPLTHTIGGPYVRLPQHHGRPVFQRCVRGEGSCQVLLYYWDEIAAGQSGGCSGWYFSQEIGGDTYWAHHYGDSYCADDRIPPQYGWTQCDADETRSREGGAALRVFDCIGMEELLADWLEPQESSEVAAKEEVEEAVAEEPSEVKEEEEADESAGVADQEQEDLHAGGEEDAAEAPPDEMEAEECPQDEEMEAQEEDEEQNEVDPLEVKEEPEARAKEEEEEEVEDQEREDEQYQKEQGDLEAEEEEREEEEIKEEHDEDQGSQDEEQKGAGEEAEEAEAQIEEDEAEEEYVLVDNEEVEEEEVEEEEVEEENAQMQDEDEEEESRGHDGGEDAPEEGEQEEEEQEEKRVPPPPPPPPVPAKARPQAQGPKAKPPEMPPPAKARPTRRPQMAAAKPSVRIPQRPAAAVNKAKAWAGRPAAFDIFQANAAKPTEKTAKASPLRLVRKAVNDATQTDESSREASRAASAAASSSKPPLKLTRNKPEVATPKFTRKPSVPSEVPPPAQPLRLIRKAGSQVSKQPEPAEAKLPKQPPEKRRKVEAAHAPATSLRDWLLQLDSKGTLLQYLDKLQGQFDDLSQIALMKTPGGGSLLACVDPVFFETVEVQTLGHKFLFAKGISKLQDDGSG